jgi:AcrR family transcriptional regulator
VSVELVPTRERILLEAAQLIATQGYGTTSTRDIATAVGITQPGLYRHFVSKDEILIALFDRATAFPMALAAELARTRAPHAVRLYRYLYESSQHLATAPFVLAAVVHTPELQMSAFANQNAALSGLAKRLDRMITGAIHDGDFRAANVRSTTLMIFELTNVFASAAPQTTALEDLLEFVFASLLHRRSTMSSVRSAALALSLRASANHQSVDHQSVDHQSVDQP